MTQTTIDTGGRGTGRTTRKIKQAIKDMIEGKHVVFVCISQRHADDAIKMMQRLMPAEYDYVTGHLKIERQQGGCIEFVSFEQAAHSLLGLSAGQLRVDHAVIEAVMLKLESAYMDQRAADEAIAVAQRALDIARARRNTADAKVSESRELLQFIKLDTDPVV